MNGIAVERLILRRSVDKLSLPRKKMPTAGKIYLVQSQVIGVRHHSHHKWM